MRIGVAQLRPVAGDVEGNLEKHLQLIELAASVGADIVVFPELSVTGYEPRLAARLRINAGDPKLRVFQDLSNARGMTIGVGAPTDAGGGVRISMHVFAPGAVCRTYSKQLLHADELPFFVAGTEPVLLRLGGQAIAPAICYESLQSEHAAAAARMGATVYLASVAKSAGGVSKAYSHYPEVARRHSMTVMMANSVGACDGFVSVGRSSAWNSRGEFLGALDDAQQGAVVFDSQAEEVTVLSLAL
jgi:predicted amidohydrolase